MKSKTISRLPGAASEGARTGFVLLLIPNPVPKFKGAAKPLKETTKHAVLK